MTYIFLFLILTTEAFTSEALYKSFQEYYHKVTPQDFIARVTGALIKKSINKIPLESRCSGKQTARYIYIKGFTEQIIIENVEQPYATQLQNALTLYTDMRRFLEDKISFRDFSRTIAWQEEEDPRWHKVRIKKHKSSDKNYFYIYFDKTLKLKKIELFSTNTPAKTITIQYTKIKQYHIISKIKISSPQTSKNPILIHIDQHRINLGLTPNDIIHTQGDCPSLHFLDFKRTK